MWGEKRLGERAVAVPVVAIESNVTGLGGVGDHRADARFDAGETAAEIHRPAHRHAACKRLGQGVVAAGIEKHQIGRPVAVHLPQDRRQLDGAEIEVRLIVELGIDRREIIGAIDLQTMTGVIEKRHISTFQRTRKITHQTDHLVNIGVETFQHLKSKTLKRRRHGVRIVLGIGQTGRVLIGRVADDEGDPALGLRRRDTGYRNAREEHQGEYNPHATKYTLCWARDQALRALLPFSSLL